MVDTAGAKPLRVAIVGKANRLGGGASKVSELMAESLTALGHHVDRYSIHRTEPDPEGIPLHGRWRSTLFRRAHNASRRWLGGEFFPFELPRVRRWPGMYDVVHVNDHWTAVSPWTIAWLSRRMPTAVTLHDPSYFTGGCMYPHECTRFETGCGMCPQKGSLGMAIDTTHAAWQMKKRILAGADVTVFAPSEWMADLAVRSPIVPRRPTVIVNCVRTKIFRPAAREGARARLRLAPDESVVLLGASSLTDPRKGVHLAVEAINLLKLPRPTVLLLGRDADSLGSVLQTRVVAAGFVSEERELAGVYAAADLFVFPSFTENCPLSVIESLACGTPVICFDRGGTPELVRSGVNGEIVSEVSAGHLSEAISGWLERFPQSDFQRDAIAESTTEYSLERFGTELAAAYREMIRRHRHRDETQHRHE
ncbi:MAG: glycosyltransferase [Thermoanaerobaculia bacterium]